MIRRFVVPRCDNREITQAMLDEHYRLLSKVLPRASIKLTFFDVVVDLENPAVSPQLYKTFYEEGQKYLAYKLQNGETSAIHHLFKGSGYLISCVDDLLALYCLDLEPSSDYCRITEEFVSEVITDSNTSKEVLQGLSVDFIKAPIIHEKSILGSCILVNGWEPFRDYLEFFGDKELIFELQQNSFSEEIIGNLPEYCFGENLGLFEDIFVNDMKVVVKINTLSKKITRIGIHSTIDWSTLLNWSRITPILFATEVQIKYREEPRKPEGCKASIRKMNCPGEIPSFLRHTQTMWISDPCK